MKQRWTTWKYFSEDVVGPQRIQPQRNHREQEFAPPRTIDNRYWRDTSRISWLRGIPSRSLELRYQELPVFNAYRIPRLRPAVQTLPQPNLLVGTYFFMLTQQQISTLMSVHIGVQTTMPFYRWGNQVCGTKTLMNDETESYSMFAQKFRTNLISWTHDRWEVWMKRVQPLQCEYVNTVPSNHFCTVEVMHYDRVIALKWSHTRWPWVHSMSLTTTSILNYMYLYVMLC